MATLDDLVSQITQGADIASWGDALNAASHFAFGQTAQAGEKFQADQLRQEGGQAIASAQRTMENVQLQTQLITSRALAVAGASGGGVSDPGVVSLIANNAKIGAYKAQTALYQGMDRARLMNLQADAKEFQGKETALNSDLVTGANVLKGASDTLAGKARVNSLLMATGGDTMYTKYGRVGRPQSASIPTAMNDDEWAPGD